MGPFLSRCPAFSAFSLRYQLLPVVRFVADGVDLQTQNCLRAPDSYPSGPAPPLSNPDVVPIAIRIPRAVVCLVSALAHHGLTTQVPHAVDIALPSHAQVPKVDGVPLRVFWYPESSFRAGVDQIKVDDVPVKIYSPEKTIADCFKYRNAVKTCVSGDLGSMSEVLHGLLDLLKCHFARGSRS